MNSKALCTILNLLAQPLYLIIAQSLKRRNKKGSKYGLANLHPTRLTLTYASLLSCAVL